MNSDSSVIPCRFLVITAHFVTTVSILLSRDANIQACLPLQYSDSEYHTKDIQLIIGLSLTIALIIFELLGFLFGISMFAPLTSLISIIFHAAACISLFYFVFDVWDCDLYWWIFGFCSILPAFAEMLAMIQLMVLKKGI